MRHLSPDAFRLVLVGTHAEFPGGDPPHPLRVSFAVVWIFDSKFCPQTM